jgi:preprotein translocase subunit SecG
VEAVKIGLQVVLVLGGLFLTLLILLHKGKGGGLSDMFGGGMSSTMGGSSVAERNLDRFTVALGIIWFITVVGLGLLARFSA